MTNLFSLLASRKLLRRLAPMAREISNQSHADVWNRVRDLIFDMDLVEARGYVRARATKVVRRRVAVAVAGQQDLDDQARQLLSKLATERVVQLVVTDFVSGSPAARRAA